MRNRSSPARNTKALSRTEFPEVVAQCLEQGLEIGIVSVVAEKQVSGQKAIVRVLPALPPRALRLSGRCWHPLASKDSR